MHLLLNYIDSSGETGIGLTRKIKKMKVLGIAPKLEASNNYYGVAFDIGGQTYFLNKENMSIEFDSPQRIDNLRLRCVRYVDDTGSVVYADVCYATLDLEVE